MQLVLLILINIIMATVFYLILRFKLENSVNDYREKKLRREMDIIISEFNSTAERNISILENRISILKSILDKTGNFKSININLNDSLEDCATTHKMGGILQPKAGENMKSPKGIEKLQNYSNPLSDVKVTAQKEYGIKTISPPAAGERHSPIHVKYSSGERTIIEKKIENENSEVDILNHKHQIIEKSGRDIDTRIKSYFSDLRYWITGYAGELITKAIHYRQDLLYRTRPFQSSTDLPGKDERKEGLTTKDTAPENISSVSDIEKVPNLNIKFGKDISQSIETVESQQNYLYDENEQELLHLNEIEISNMFLSSEDKYSLISELHERGYTSDFLSKCSGIPVGEVNLVLDLNS